MRTSGSKKNMKDTIRIVSIYVMAALLVLSFCIFPLGASAGLSGTEEQEQTPTTEMIETPIIDDSSEDGQKDGTEDNLISEDPVISEEPTSVPSEIEGSGPSEEVGADEGRTEEIDFGRALPAITGRNASLFSTGQAEPVHRKYVEPQSNGTYTLTLEVSGDTQQVSYAADVVIMFDASASTTSSMFTSYQQAANTFVDMLLTAENSALPQSKQLRVAIISFGSTVKTLVDFSSNKDTVKAGIDSIAYHTGEYSTNWSGAIDQANSMLATAASTRPDTRCYSLFLTDGGPTGAKSNWIHYVEAETRATNMMKAGTSLYTIGVLDNSPDPTVFMPYVRLEAGEGAAFLSTDYRALSPSDGYEYSTSALAIRAYKFAGREAEANGKYYILDRDSGQEYVNAFKEIASDVSGQKDYGYVTITDELSDYSALLNGVAAVGGRVDCTVEKVYEGSSSAVSDYSVTYDSATKRITFSINEVLAHKTTYRAILSISPSQKAYDELASNRASSLNVAAGGYPHVGGTNTGSASTASPGFYSNNSATLKYYVVEDGALSGSELTGTPFEMPVIQLQLSSIFVQKMWAAQGAVAPPEYIDVVLLQDGTPYRNVRLTKAEYWVAFINDVPAGPTGHIYSLQETSITGYQASYAPGSARLSGLNAQSASFGITNTPTTIPIQFKKISNTYYSEGQITAEALKGAEFELYAWIGNGSPTATDLVNDTSIAAGRWQLVGAATSQDDGAVTLSVAATQTGALQLVEKKAPTNYQVPAGQWRFTLSNYAIDLTSITKILGADGTTPPALEVASTGPFEGELILSNVSEYELPMMGAIGIDGYLRSGLALIAAAASIYMSLFIRKRRRR